jgi:hypothetical protein
MARISFDAALMNVSQLIQSFSGEKSTKGDRENQQASKRH